MKRSTLIIIISLVVAFIGIGIFVSMRNSEEKEKQNAAIEEYDLYSIIEGDENNGGIGDHIKGTVEGVEPEVYIYEYADYQCPGCATTNPWINEVLESFNGKAAIVYRSFLLSYHQTAERRLRQQKRRGFKATGKNMRTYYSRTKANGSIFQARGEKKNLLNILKPLAEGQETKRSS